MRLSPPEIKRRGQLSAARAQRADVKRAGFAAAEDPSLSEGCFLRLQDVEGLLVERLSELSSEAAAKGCKAMSELDEIDRLITNAEQALDGAAMSIVARLAHPVHFHNNAGRSMNGSVLTRREQARNNRG
jgi:hypothetical protein